MNTLPGSPTVTKLMAILAVLLAALLVFWAGMAVGSRKARFSSDWENNYASRFGGPGSPLVPQGAGDDSFMSAHGAYGEVVGVRLPQVIVKGSAESEKSVLVTGATEVRRLHSYATTTDIAPGQTVVVIGEPDGQGDIQASLVRIVADPGTPAGQN